MIYYLPAVKSSEFSRAYIPSEKARELAPDAEFSADDVLFVLSIHEQFLRDPQRLSRDRDSSEDPSSGDVIIAESSQELGSPSGKSYGVLKVLSVSESTRKTPGRIFSLLVSEHKRSLVGTRKTWNKE